LNVHLIPEAAKLVESEVSTAINISSLALESTDNQKLNSIIFGRYLSHELLCLYAEIAAWFKDANNYVLLTVTAFEEYLQRVANTPFNETPSCAPELQMYHKKIMTLALGLRKAVMVT